MAGRLHAVIRWFPILAPLLVLLSACTSLPEVRDKPVTRSLPSPESGPLVTTARQLEVGRAADKCSVLLLAENQEALDWRLALVDSARSSLDIQLYLWHDGSSGRLLLDRVLRAADRGVRVRILVDDFLFRSDERKLAAFCRENPNLDIRIFNPTRIRGSVVGSALEFGLNFVELNRRMHNKTFTADRCLSIVGGRNVSDHYFGLDEDYNFLDLDVLVAGPVVDEVAEGFDEFWNSAAAYPGGALSSRGGAEEVARARVDLTESLEAERAGRLGAFPLEPRDWSSPLASLQRRMVHGRVRFLQDSPSREADQRQVVAGIREMAAQGERELLVVSPYLLPSEGVFDEMAQARKRGVRIGVLAPSLAANNQPLAHGHYRKKRKRLIDEGVFLFELRDQPRGKLRQVADTPPVRCGAVNLHAKALVGDRRHCFIGSMNLDPRAMRINTESGLLIDSPELSDELFSLLRHWSGPGNAWQVIRDERGRLVWKDGDQQVGKPGAPWGKRVLAFIAGLLPIESQL